MTSLHLVILPCFLQALSDAVTIQQLTEQAAQLQAALAAAEAGSQAEAAAAEQRAQAEQHHLAALHADHKAHVQVRLLSHP